MGTAGLGDCDGSYGIGGPWWGSVRVMVATVELRELGDHGGHCGAGWLWWTPWGLEVMRIITGLGAHHGGSHVPFMATLGLGAHHEVLTLPLCPTIRPRRSPQPPPRTSGPLTSSSHSRCRRARSQVRQRVVGTGMSPLRHQPPLLVPPLTQCPQARCACPRGKQRGPASPTTRTGR